MTVGIKQPAHHASWYHGFLTGTDPTGWEGKMVMMASDGLVALANAETVIAIGVVSEVHWWSSTKSEGKVTVLLNAPKRKGYATAVINEGVEVAVDLAAGTDGYLITSTSAYRSVGVAITATNADTDIFYWIPAPVHLLA